MSLELNDAARAFSQTRGTIDPAPPYSLAAALEYADEIFGIDRILADSDSEFVDNYYRQSLVGYSTLYNPWQCMHVALHEPGASEEEAFFAQAAEVADHLTGEPGERVLELGCGLGANTLHLGARHPEVEFTGLDLMAEHVARASLKALRMGNVTFRQTSFEDLPPDLGAFDVIFAVETLCYARNPEQMALALARHLRPGGRVILFDAHRKAGFAKYPAGIVTAARLYEISTAVTRGFHAEGSWEAAFARAGLTGIRQSDITDRTRHGLATLHRRAAKAFTDRKWRAALRMMPRYFARNTVAGLLGYHVCFGDGPRPDPAQGAIAYQRIVAEKPRG